MPIGAYMVYVALTLIPIWRFYGIYFLRPVSKKISAALEARRAGKKTRHVNQDRAARLEAKDLQTASR